MKNKTILVDMDDTIINLCEVWVAYINEKHGTKVHINDIKDWDMSKAFPSLEKRKIY